MTNAELLAKIKAEIERRINELGISDESILLEAELSEILSFLSTLESEKPEADLEKEIETSIRCLNGLHTLENNKSWYKGRYEELKELARHFYEFGCRRTAEKYDEIEYNRQRASGSSEIPNDLEEAARYYLLNEHGSPLNAVFHQADPKSEMVYHKDIENAFIAGAKWQKQHDAELIEIAYNDGITIGMTKQKEQMMKEAVEGEIRGDIRSQEEKPYQIWAESDFLPLNREFKIGDKVRIIIVKED